MQCKMLNENIKCKYKILTSQKQVKMDCVYEQGLECNKLKHGFKQQNCGQPLL